MGCHVEVTIDHIGGLSGPTLGDMWKPPCEPCGHYDINTMSSQDRGPWDLGRHCGEHQGIKVEIETLL